MTNRFLPSPSAFHGSSSSNLLVGVMKTFIEELPGAAVQHSIRLPTIKLKPSRLLADGEDHDSVEQLAHYLAVQCITCLVDLVRDRDPLAEEELTSVVWLRTNGDIELVRETNFRQRTLGDLVADSLYIDAFRSRRDAVPFSLYHRWIADAEGEYVGDMKGRKHCIRPAWDKVSSIANTDVYSAAINAIDWTRLRIEPVGKVEALGIIKKCKYREALRNRINKWILEGHFSATLEMLSLIGLKRAVQVHGMDFLERYGREPFYRILSARVQQAFAERATGSSNAGD